MDRFSRQGIYESLADVFETVFLIHLEMLDEAAPSRKILERRRDYLEVKVDLLRGNNSPAFFFFPAGLIKEIAGSFLGMDEGIMDNGALAQVAKMAARMTIGGLLGRVDPEALIRAGEPQARNIDSFNPGRLFEAPGVWVYQTDQGYLWVDVGRIGEVAHH
jgi:hypothetical protein